MNMHDSAHGPAQVPAWRVAIVDDEALARSNLHDALASHTDFQIVGEYSRTAEARSALASTRVDLLFLDIRMPGQTGLDFAREYCQSEEAPLIVFVTAFDAHAVEAFEVHALDYLLKPYSDARLAQCMQHARLMLGQAQGSTFRQAQRECVQSMTETGNTTTPVFWQQIRIKSVGRIECVQLADVQACTAAGNYVELHLAGRTVLHRITMNTLVEHLDPEQFIRVHRSAVVHRQQIARLESLGDGQYELILHNGQRHAISERYLDLVRGALTTR